MLETANKNPSILERRNIEENQDKEKKPEKEKRQRGRPKKKNAQSIPVTTYLDQKTYDLFEEKCSNHGMNISAKIRELIIKSI